MAENHVNTSAQKNKALPNRNRVWRGRGGSVAAMAQGSQEPLSDSVPRSAARMPRAPVSPGGLAKNASLGP